ncbi:MAG: Hsp20/alpha crystallin family protein [Actinobacteria bacterium]|nr:Hsp20/alpha crystallin family protein [Actinomycetota bacterium]
MVMRFDPFRELDRLNQELWSSTQRRASGMPMDAYRQGDTFFIHFDLPGVDPATIDLTVEKNVLTVRAERQFDWAGNGAEVLVAERPQGTYSRQLFLGETLDADRIQANYEHGVLTLTIPVAEAAKPRRVQVSAQGGADAITAQAGEARAG